jgi:transposase
VERRALQQLLDQGVSLAEIARRHVVHESTVGYWVKKHGLQAAQRAKHAARGGLRREQLESLVQAGLSTREIAERLQRSQATVRHWLREYGLTTLQAERRRASVAGRKELTLECARHGSTTFRMRPSGGYRCLKCRAEAVAARRRKIKQILVAEAGGACQLCGYDRCISALEFHHLVPSEKSFALSHRGVARSLEKARTEAQKCVLLCANCHAEVEAGLIEVS